MDGQEEKSLKNKYAHLDKLSTETLEALLYADIESPDNDNDETVLHILEVIEQREKEHPTGRLSDVDKMWAEFQQYYNTPEGRGLSLYPMEDGEEDFAGEEEEGLTVAQTQTSKVIRVSHVLKVAGIAAAVVVGIFGLMIGAQAAGIDVFGAIGRWTDETFHFAIFTGSVTDGISEPSVFEGYTQLQAALDDCGITEKLAPTWCPEGFETFGPEVLSNDICDKIHCFFSDASGEFFDITIKHYKSASNIETPTFEKDDMSVEQYTSGQKTFYILYNIDTVTATWADGTLMEVISGNLSIDEFKNIIDSIGG
jgi:hypothetical protein